jgi:PAS domain S-box-containing protein
MQDDQNYIESQNEIIDVVLDSMGEAVIVINPDGRTIRNCNSAAESMFGYQKSELIGQKTLILHINREYYDRFGEISEAILKKGQVYKDEFQMKRKDGRIIDTFHTVSPIKKEMGWEEGVVSIIRDITEQKQAEKQIKNNLHDRTILLAEIHHRVKNNLAIIASLLYMQMEESDNNDVKTSLQTSYSRLQSIALVHEQLYQKAEQDAIIYLDSYLPQLVDKINEVIDLSDKSIETEVEAGHISLPLGQAVSAGLLISELLMNAYKHAFKNKEEGHIIIKSHFNNKKLILRVSDNGVGLPDNFTLNSGSNGMVIIKTLAKQLNGELTFTSDSKQGTTFSISFELND